ncbi:hypothetical protein LRP88_00017 [Fusarium phalaenopsidis]
MPEALVPCVFGCRRPGDLDSAKTPTRLKKVKAVDSWSKGEKSSIYEMVHLVFPKQEATSVPRLATIDRAFNLVSIANTAITKAEPAVFGSSLPGAEVKLLHQASASMAEPARTSKIGASLTKE